MARRIALLLTFVTGFSGLVYEVSWQRYLATLLGSHSEATAAVLGIFLGGLAGGYALFGGVARRIVARGADSARSRLLVAYAIVEAAIGFYALAFPTLFSMARALSALLPSFGGGADFAVDVALSALLIGPPTLCMGATIPLLTQALPRGIADATRIHAVIYALNTAGAFAGALCAGYFLIPALGLVGVITAMSILNLAAAGLYLLVASAAGEEAPIPAEAPPSEEARLPDFWRWACVAALLGFAMMAVQTVLIRIGGLAFGSSEYTFTLVVATFVLCIALGSSVVSLLPSIRPFWLWVDLWGLALLLTLLYLCLDVAPYWVHRVRVIFASHDGAFYPFQLGSFLLLLFSVGPAIVLSGASLPLLFDRLRRQVDDLGPVAGRLYGWNTFGSLCGALLGGYLLLSWLDLHHVYRIAIAAVVVAALLASVRRVEAIWGTVPPLFAVAALGLVSLPVWSEQQLSLGSFRMRIPRPATDLGAAAMAERHGQNVIFYDDDPTLTAVVTERDSPNGIARSIVTNGKADGNTDGDFATMTLLGIVPALLSEELERVFVVGYGTGVTAGELARIRAVKEVVVAEISQGVLDAAPLFDFANHELSRSPKLNVLRSDAYRALARERGHYDLIVSEPSNPWVTGVEMLYSIEYLETARERLSPGGVYAQWMHQYETSDEAVALVLRSFAAVFPAISVWYTMSQDLIVFGFNDPNAESERFVDRALERMAWPSMRDAFERLGIASPAALMAHELIPVAVLDSARLRGPLHTLLHPRLAHEAGRAFFRGDSGDLPFTGNVVGAAIGEENSLLRRLGRLRGGLAEPVYGTLVPVVCRHRTGLCAVLLAHWRHRFGESAGWERALGEAQSAWSKNTYGPRFDRGVIRDLGRLFPNDESGGDVKPVDAARATRQYRDFFHHAFPFDPERLIAIWERCVPMPAAPLACQAGATRAREMLGYVP